MAEKSINLLKESPVNVDINDYYDEGRKLYNTVPVFPFLDDTVIEQQIQFSIDAKKLREEISTISAHAHNEGALVKPRTFAICLTDWNTYPQLICLLTIIREWAFRNEGGGVGDFDEDAFDSLPEMKQLIIVNTEYQDPIEAIIGGYRYMVHHYDSYERGPMGAHYKFSEEWKQQKWIELGRSFINPWFKDKDRKQSFDYVLQGLGYVYSKNPTYQGYFGKVTLYKMYEMTGADKFFLACAANYLNKSKSVYVNPDEKIEPGIITEEQKVILDVDVFKGLFMILRREYSINMVPIMAVYNRMVDLSKMHYFGAFRHKEFGETTEVGIAIGFEDLYETIKDKFTRLYH